MGCLKSNVFIKKPVNLKQSLTIYSYIIYYTTSLTDEAKILTLTTHENTNDCLKQTNKQTKQRNIYQYGLKPHVKSPHSSFKSDTLK